MDKHAMKNDKAHRRLGLEFDQAMIWQNSPALVGELAHDSHVLPERRRLRHDFRLRGKGRKALHPACLDQGPYHGSPGRNFGVFGDAPVLSTHRYAARKTL